MKTGAVGKSAASAFCKVHIELNAAITTFLNISPPSMDTPPPASYKSSVEFTPPLIAMVIIIVSAFIIITFSRLFSHRFLQFYRFHRRRRRQYVPSSPTGDVFSIPYSYDSPRDDNFYVFSPDGLDEAVVKTIPLSVYTRKSGFHDCAVCLLEFEENDYVRTLPICAHTFHVDCIDEWLRAHPNCPLCRTGILRRSSPFRPLMAARIRPDLDVMIAESAMFPAPVESEAATVCEITHEPTPRQSVVEIEDRFSRRNFLLKRSYSFGFERNLASDRLATEPSTASPFRFLRGGGGGFWSKRSSPLLLMTKPRVLSLNHYRSGTKSPFFRRRSLGSFFPLSESSVRGSAGCSSRRCKSTVSPMFLRWSTTTAAANVFSSSSRLRSGDPEALLSPERWTRR